MNPEQFPENPESREGEHVRFAAESVESEHHPERNEDDFFVLPERSAAGVFDGMSIPPGGEIAAQLARETIRERLAARPEPRTPEEAQQAIVDALRSAEQAIAEHIRRMPAHEGIGTTASVVQVVASEGRNLQAVVGNVGDSRVYLFHHREQLAQVTLDDSLYRYDLGEERARELQEKFSQDLDPNTLSPEERRYFSRRQALTNVLRSGASLNLRTVEVSPHDLVLVLSDGIHDNLNDREIESIIRSHENPEDAVHELIRQAQERSRDPKHPRAKPDDMTAIVVEILGKE